MIRERGHPPGDRPPEEALDDAQALDADHARRCAETSACLSTLATFGSAVSHDLREPLRTLDGFGQALVEDFGDVLPDEARLYIDRMNAATLRLRHRIDALLRLTEMVRRPFEQTEVDLGALADEAVEAERQAAPARRVEWRRDDALIVSGDIRLLRALIGELIANAWRFTAPQTEARVALERRDDGFVLRDDGVGFHPRYAERVFHAFARYHTAEEFPGAGMGLAVARCAVERHGGRISARSAVGEGTEIVFTLAPDLPLPSERNP